MGIVIDFGKMDRIVQENKTQFDALGLSRGDIKNLYRHFSEMDIDGSGEIDIGEFLDFFRMPRSKFAKRAFLICDEGKKE